MDQDRERWEDRYRAKEGTSLAPPSPLLERNSSRLPVGRALDVACGDGRNALFLARRLFTVEAIDIAFAGLARAKREAIGEGLSVSFVQADLDAFPLPRNRYDVVVNVRYLNRRILPALKESVRDGGMVLFETFLREQSRFGHPRNPAYLLERGELADAFADFALLEYEEGLFETEKDRAHLARMLAQRPRGWEPD